jgi:tRNA pseudouridine13 synthase
MASFVSRPDTFVVEEIPAYLPVGSGEHTYFWIEKRDLTTHEALRRLAQRLGVKERDGGYAGLKDRHATTRQWVSFAGVKDEAASALAAEESPGLRVLQTARHGNKLRIGHLRGNHFDMLLLDLQPGEAETLGAALLKLAAEGVPNRYGHQRFGAAGDNVATALAVLRGTRREPDRRRRDLLMSALQSAVFNRTLELRAASGGLLALREGDVLQKRGSGGLFVTTDLETDAARVAAGEVVPTGPLPGNREIEPPTGTAARAIEDEALASVGLAREELAGLGRNLPGARRPVVVALGLDNPTGAPATEIGEQVDPQGGKQASTLRLRFNLPAGSYATVALEALGVESVRSGRGERGTEPGVEAPAATADPA